MDESPVPVIVLPTNKARRQQLLGKLEEYRGRMSDWHPELKMDTIYKIVVLETLLRDGQVYVEDLEFKMTNRYGAGFDSHAFDNACGVIRDYCETGGQNAFGGTGFPPQVNLA